MTRQVRLVTPRLTNDWRTLSEIGLFAFAICDIYIYPRASLPRQPPPSLPRPPPADEDDATLQAANPPGGRDDDYSLMIDSRWQIGQEPGGRPPEHGKLE